MKAHLFLTALMAAIPSLGLAQGGSTGAPASDTVNAPSPSMKDTTLAPATVPVTTPATTPTTSPAAPPSAAPPSATPAATKAAPTGLAAAKARWDNMTHHGYAGMLLQHKADLQLAVKQVTSLDAIERDFETQTDSASRQLDSLRKINGHAFKGMSLRKLSLSSSQLKTLSQSQQTMALLALHVDSVQRQTKQRALAVLTPTQRTQVEAWEKQGEQMLNAALNAKNAGQTHTAP